MHIIGEPSDVLVLEKKKGDRIFFKVSLQIKDIDGIYPCYFWLDKREELPDLRQEVKALVKKAYKGEFFIQIKSGDDNDLL